MHKSLTRKALLWMVLSLFMPVCAWSQTIPVDYSTFAPYSTDSPVQRLRGMGQSAAWGDFDGDGSPELFVGSVNFRSKSVYLFQNNVSDFIEITGYSGLNDESIRSASVADYNNDGLPDLLLGTVKSYSAPKLYTNLGPGFVNTDYVLSSTGSGVTGHVIWLDYDRDGWPDILHVATGNIALYRNTGFGTFEDVTSKTGINPRLKSNSAVTLDYDNDGWPDIFFANKGFNSLYRNKGNGKFVDVSSRTGIFGDEKWNTVSACAGDFNNDGLPDLYAVNISTKRKALFQNVEGKRFEDITVVSGTDDIGDGRTCTWLDFDLDGLLDLYTANHLNPSKLYKNLGAGKFQDVAPQAGIDYPIDVFTSAWGDYNSDGLLDVFLTGHIGITLKTGVRGTTGNGSITLIPVRNAQLQNNVSIGAKVTLKTTAATQTRVVGTGEGAFVQNMLFAHFGIGKEKNVSIEIEWPEGGKCVIDDLKVLSTGQGVLSLGASLVISKDTCEPKPKVIY